MDEGGETLDTDGMDSKRIDIDSDGDGCNDVDEAGITTDDNNDGEVGIPIINVNSNGLVTSSGDGLYTYGIPVDLDGNGTPDFLEVGDYASVISSPDDVETPNNNEVIFVAEGQSDCALEYEWEVSTDAGLTWFSINDFENIGEQSEIMIVGGGNPRNFNSGNNYSFLELYANEDIEANKYEVVLTTTMGVKHSQIINTNISKGKYILFGIIPIIGFSFENTNVATFYGDKYGQYYTWQYLSHLMESSLLKLEP